MMRKTLLAVLLCVCVMLPAALATEDSLMSNVNQYYSVTFDGEGEAIVSLVMEISNARSDPIEDINLEIPGTSVTLLGAAQKTGGGYERQCASYDSTCVEYGTGSTCVRYDYTGNCEEYQRPCLKREQTCSYYRTVYTGQATYERLSITPEPFSKATNLPISLIQPVADGDSTQLLIMYKTDDVVSPALNGKRFSFETGKVPMTSSEVRVSVTPPEGAEIKGVGSHVNYRDNMVTDAIGAQSYSSEASKKISDHTQQVMRSYGYSRSATYLDPHESFTVSGLYAMSPFRMYLGEIIIGVLTIGAVLAGLVYGIRKLLKYAREHLKADKKKKPHGFIVPFLGGLLVAFVIVLLWCLTIFGIWALSEIFPYGAVGGIVAVVFILLVGLFTLLALIGVPVYVGVRYGGSLGLFTALSALGWIIVTVMFLFLGFVIIAMFA